MISPHLRYWLAALYLPGIGPRRLLRWLTYFNDIEALFSASVTEWQAAGLTPKQIEAFQQPNWKAVDRDLAWAEQEQHHLMVWGEEDYPQLLQEIPDPPLVLFIRGNRAALAQTQLAIVGSRHPSPAGLSNAEQFAYYLSQAGFAITSGLALGIDGAGHRGALNAHGVTIAVSGTGLNHLYPRSNQKLAEEIIANHGAVLSEFPLDTAPQAMNFPRRNRIISGLSVGVLVIEAAMKSGSLITARHALEQNREVFAIPGSIHQPLARGCHYLIRQGAKLVETYQDVMEELAGFVPRAQVVSLSKPDVKSSAEAIQPEYRSIIDQIGREITPIDMIILRSGLTRGEVSSILLKLELHGYIQAVMGGYVRATTNE